jgi:crotonobetainyl-CoA:carnitine CoA-transferase CaiB-like acyl-CoA transferase
MSYAHPYAGVKVLDLSQGYAGPYCGELLALQGAEVIKVEPPEGDWSRILGDRYDDHTTLSVVANRGKKSVVLDLKHPDGQRIARELAGKADILIESFRPGVTARLGLGYDEIRAINPRILYLAVSGFGHDGPYADRACTDTVAQAFSGLMSINHGNDGVPHRLGLFIIDCVTALYAMQAVAAALRVRDSQNNEEGGEGRFIDCSLMQSGAALMAMKIAEFQLTGGAPPLLNAPAGSYRTTDGYIAVTMVKEVQFASFARAVGEPGWLDDPRYATFEARGRNMDTLGPAVRDIIARRSSDEWLATFAEHEVLANRINDFGDWLHDPHVQAVTAADSVHQPGIGTMTLPQIPGMPPIADQNPALTSPAIGEHGRAILTDLAYDEAAIAALAAAGAVHLPTETQQETNLEDA